MKNILVLSALLVVTFVMTSCFGPMNNGPTFKESDLLGLWQEENTEAYVRFTNEQDDTGEYKFGREWDEGDGVFESDLQPYGNGWFKYKLVQSDLTEIHLMDNGGAEIPKVYTVVTLTEDVLVYQDEFKRSHRLNKMVASN